MNIWNGNWKHKAYWSSLQISCYLRKIIFKFVWNVREGYNNNFTAQHKHIHINAIACAYSPSNARVLVEDILCTCKKNMVIYVWHGEWWRLKTWMACCYWYSVQLPLCRFSKPYSVDWLHSIFVLYLTPLNFQFTARLCVNGICSIDFIATTTSSSAAIIVIISVILSSRISKCIYQNYCTVERFRTELNRTEWFEVFFPPSLIMSYTASKAHRQMCQFQI